MAAVGNVDVPDTDQEHEVAHRQSRGDLKRISIGAADQGMSSLSNFVPSLAGAVLLSAAGFGEFSLIFAAYVLANGIIRSVVSDTIVVMHSDDDPGTVHEIAREGMAVALACGGLASAILASVALISASASVKSAELLLALWMPALACQDYLRYVAFAAARPVIALVSDSVWVVGAVVGVCVYAIAGTTTVATLTGVWGASGGAAAATALLLTRIPPPYVPHASGAVGGWLRRYRRLYPHFTLDFLAQQTNGPLILFIISALLGPLAAGAIRGAQLLFTPLTIFINGSRVAVIPELVRLRRESTVLWRRGVKQIVVGLALVCAAWSVIVILLPTRIGSALLGETWASAEPLILPMSLVIVGLGIVSGEFAAVRSIADAAGSLRARLISAIGVTAAATVGALVGGTLGAVVGMALAAPLAVAVWAVQLRKSDENAADRSARDIEREMTSTPCAEAAT